MIDKKTVKILLEKEREIESLKTLYRHNYKYCGNLTTKCHLSAVELPKIKRKQLDLNKLKTELGIPCNHKNKIGEKSLFSEIIIYYCKDCMLKFIIENGKIILID